MAKGSSGESAIDAWLSGEDAGQFASVGIICLSCISCLQRVSKRIGDWNESNRIIANKASV